jgi:ankyrin repeat protein
MYSTPIALRSWLSLLAMEEIKKLIVSLDFAGLRDLLSREPALANDGIPFDEKNPTVAHPLHRICDGVFHGIYTDEAGVQLATIFLENGSKVDGYAVPLRDSPLTAACSLHADKVALLYIEKGANIHHPGTSGGTAIHWAAWTGRPQLVEVLIKAGADVHRRCVEFNSTPLLWAVHGYKTSTGDKGQIECAKLLIAAGAERNTSNFDGKNILDFLDNQDSALREMLTI